VAKPPYLLGIIASASQGEVAGECPAGRGKCLGIRIGCMGYVHSHN
jgi:hypothetical protein